MKIEAKKKRVVSIIDTVIIDGVEFDAYRLLECLDALEETDGAFSTITISGPSTERILLKYKLAYKNVRGSWAKHMNTNKIKKFKEKIYQALDKIRPPRAPRL